MSHQLGDERGMVECALVYTGGYSDAHDPPDDLMDAVIQAQDVFRNWLTFYGWHYLGRLTYTADELAAMRRVFIRGFDRYFHINLGIPEGTIAERMETMLPEEREEDWGSTR